MTRNQVAVLALVGCLLLGAGLAYAYKLTLDSQQRRLEENVRAYESWKKESAEFQKCYGDLLKEARLNDQRRRAAESADPGRARLSKHYQDSEEAFLWDLWRASGKKCSR
jgi:hypothetical protein